MHRVRCRSMPAVNTKLLFRSSKLILSDSSAWSMYLMPPAPHGPVSYCHSAHSSRGRPFSTDGSPGTGLCETLLDLIGGYMVKLVFTVHFGDPRALNRG